MPKARYTQFFTFIFLSVIWFSIGWLAHTYFTSFSASPVPRLTNEQQLILKAQQAISMLHYDQTEISADDLADAAIRGMLTQTNDPYSALFTSPVVERFAKDFAGETGVSSFFFDIIDDQLIIADVVWGQPADRAGLKIGDILLGVDGYRFGPHISGDEASILLRGPVGSYAKVEVLRGDQILTLDILREARNSVSSKMLGQIGYLRINSVPPSAVAAVKQELEALVQQDMQALIWDLRHSGGGSMPATKAILDYFIEKGVLYHAEFKGGREQTVSAKGNALLPELPLVILIDNQTYSSSEMAAIVMAESGRATLLGTTTKGKGMIQDIIELDQGHLLRLSIAKWLSPSGEWIQGKGVVPDIEVIDDPATVEDEVLVLAIATLQQYIKQ